MAFPVAAAVGLGSGLLSLFGQNRAEKQRQKAAKQQRQDRLASDRYRYDTLTKPELERRAHAAARSGKLSSAFLRGSGLSGLWGEDELKRRETVAPVAAWDDRMSDAYGSAGDIPQGGGFWDDLASAAGMASQFIPASTPKAGIDYRTAGMGGGGGGSMGFSGANPFGSRGQGTDFELQPRFSYMD